MDDGADGGGEGRGEGRGKGEGVGEGWGRLRLVLPSVEMWNLETECRLRLRLRR